jgi:amino acid transporter
VIMAQRSMPTRAHGGQPGFRREVGLMALMFVSLGSIIGSGWLLGALTAATSAGGASIVSWLLAGVIVTLLALVHAELGAAYPLAGGTARWPRLTFGSLGGFTAGWVAWLQAVTTGPIEVEAALSYLNHKWHGLINDVGALTTMGLGVATVLMLLFAIINILGVRWLAKSNTITVLWKITIPVLTVIVLITVSFHAPNFTAGGGFAPYGAHGVFAALPLGVVFAMYGFEQTAQMSGEVRDPHRTRPYHLPVPSVLAPLAFIAANEIIYWTSWTTVEKLMLVIAAGYVLFGISYALGRPIERPPLDPQSLIWILPWFTGLTVISYLGQYGGTKLIPEWIDLGVVAVFSLLICTLAVHLRLPAERVTATVAADLNTPIHLHPTRTGRLIKGL